VTIEFVGGFAWLFAQTGEAYVALVHKTGSKFNHQMVLEVAQKDVIASATTAKPIKVEKGMASYLLEDDVSLAVDGASLPTGKVVEEAGGTIYSISLINKRPQPKVAADWRAHTSVRLLLPSGRVKVSRTNEQSARFVDGNGKKFERRDMATRSTFHPPGSPPKTVDFTAKGGRVSIKTGNGSAVRISAQCDCDTVEPNEGDPLPGFDDVFVLYPSTLAKADRVMALAAPILATPKSAMAGPASGGPGFVTPGPDCLKTKHAI
jgi:hypothetical protein